MADIELRTLTAADVVAHIAGEDAEVVRWLNGSPSSEEATRRHFDMLAQNAVDGTGKRGFGVWLDDRLAGYVDANPDCDGCPAPGDVNLAYMVHPWARGRGIATAAVEAMCAYISEHEIGRRAIIRAEVGNPASAAVARRSGFHHLADVAAVGEYTPEGAPVIHRVYARELSMSHPRAFSPTG